MCTDNESSQLDIHTCLSKERKKIVIEMSDIADMTRNLRLQLCVRLNI